MPLLPTFNPPPTSSSKSTSIPDDFPQNPTSEARGKDAIDAKNNSNEKKTVDEVEKERLYEEKIEEEYAKREGGAWGYEGIDGGENLREGGRGL